MRIYRLIFGLFTALTIANIFISCGTTGTLRPKSYDKVILENTTDTLINTIPKSDIILSFEISKYSLVDSFQRILDSILIEDLVFLEQGLVIDMQRLDGGQIEMQGKEILIKFPLNIRVLKHSFIGMMQAYGKANLTFISKIDIDHGWKLTTQTKLEYYEWLERPKFNIGFITVPVKWLTDEIVKRIKSQVEFGIDESIAQNFNLPARMREITEVLYSPYQLDSTTGGYIYMRADSAFLAPVSNDEYYSVSKLYTPVSMIMQSRIPSFQERETKLPEFAWKEDIPDSSTFRLWVDLQYEYLNNIAKQNFTGKTFSSGSKSVTVEDLRIYGNNNRLFVTCRTTGSFKGEITIAGIPHYADGILNAKDIEWEIKTGNVLHQAASWLGKGYIYDQLNQMLTFDITQYAERAKEEIALKLGELKENRKLSVDIEWGPIQIDQMRTRLDGLQGLMEVKLKVHVVIDDLTKLQMNGG